MVGRVLQCPCPYKPEGLCQSDVNGGVCNLTTKNGNCRADMQWDGNAVVYRNGTSAKDSIRASNTARFPGPNRLVMQGDGNLVAYAKNNDVIWKSDTMHVLIDRRCAFRVYKL